MDTGSGSRCRAEPGAGGVSFGTILSANAATGRGIRTAASSVASDDIVLDGDFRLLRLKSGLVLHATDAVDRRNLITEVEHEAGLTVGIFLCGRADISVGRQDLKLGTGWRNRPETGGEAFLLSYAEPDCFVRRGIPGNRVRKVCVNIPPDWMEQGAEADGFDAAALHRLMQAHTGHLVWQPSARHRQLAEQILASAPYNALLRRLHTESHAIEIVAEALGLVAAREVSGGIRQPSGRDRLRIAEACDFIEGRGEDLPSLHDVAGHVGVSVSALQRICRAVHGTSIFEQVRARRLERARGLLERDGVSVTEAAYIAGYASAANFATAFKRRFGVSPRDVRPRVAGYTGR
ncbi:AraC family transcriptional regulator [Ferrovibrio sp.]|uniref:helix-turn-helix transcriptional regulator n=1 Tax=Ferrovibrio sp. TaxID=1917215 RepID=UPI00311E8440